MNEADIRKQVLDALAGIAPEADPGKLDPEVNLRDQLDFDSVDFLNLMLALHQRLGVDIPELDYPQLTCINSAVRYLAKRLAV
jgi:acyl carrier protein